MKHGKITDIDCLKKAVQKSTKPLCTFANRPYYFTASGSNKGAYAIQRRGGCDFSEVGVVLNEDGSYHLHWDAGNMLINLGILRAVKRIVALYNEELAVKEKSYDQEQTDIQNQTVTEKKTQNTQRIRA